MPPDSIHAPTHPTIDSWWTPPNDPPDRHGPTNHPFDPPDLGFSDRSIFATFTAIATRQPNAPAIRGGARGLTYAQAHQLAQSLARRIAAVTAPGDGIAVLLNDDLEVVVAQMACFGAGRVCLLLNPAHPAERIATILASAAPGHC